MAYVNLSVQLTIAVYVFMHRGFAYTAIAQKYRYMLHYTLNYLALIPTTVFSYRLEENEPFIYTHKENIRHSEVYDNFIFLVIIY